jgi:hypothetical protein
MFLMLTGVSSISVLASCDFTEAKNPFGPGRPDQVVEGMRRTPIFNQSMIKRIEEKSGAPYGQEQAIPPDGAAEGNFLSRMWGSEEAAAPETSTPGTATPAPEAQSAAPQQLAAISPRVVRKPIPGNPYFASTSQPDQYQLESMAAANVSEPVAPVQRETIASAQVAEAPPTPAPSRPAGQSLFSRIFGSPSEPQPESLPPPWKMRQGLTTEDQSAAHAGKSGQEAPQEQRQEAAAPEWADRWVGRPAADINAPMQAEQNAPYPSLSSVPQVPAGVDAARAAGQQDMQSLQSEQYSAQQQRNALYGEPSQQQNMTPVEMPPAVQIPAETPAQAPAQAPEYSAPSQQAAPGTPRRGVDIMTQEEWEALQRAQQQGTYLQPPAYDGSALQPATPQQAPAADAGQTREASKVSQGWDLMSETFRASDEAPASPEVERAASEPASGKPSFFARIFGSRDKHEQSDTHIQGAASSDNVTEQPQQEFALPEPKVLADDELRATSASEKSAEERLARGDKAPVVQFMEPGNDNAMPQDAGQPAESVSAQETASATAARDAENDTSPRDWLQALVSRNQANAAAPAQAQEAKETEVAAPAKAPAADQDKSGSFFISPAYAEPAAATVGEEKELLGQIKAPPIQEGLESDTAQPEVMTGKALVEPPMLDAVPLPEKTSAQEAEKPSSETAALPEKETMETPRRRSLFSRIFAREETPQASENASAEPATPAQEMAPAQPAEAAEQWNEQPAAMSPAMAAVMKKPDTAQPAQEEPVSQAVDMPQASPVDPVARPLNEQALADTRAAQASDTAAAAQEPTPESRPRSLFSRLFSSGGDTASESVVEAPAQAAAETAPAEPVAVPMPVPVEVSQPASIAPPAEKKPEEKLAVEPVKTESAEGGPFLPPLSGVAAPVMQVTTGDKALTGVAADASSGALPSPKILQEIKMLPASRYSARKRAANTSKEEN